MASPNAIPMLIASTTRDHLPASAKLATAEMGCLAMTSMSAKRMYVLFRPLVKTVQAHLSVFAILASKVME
jgi:hypothetical protein